MTRVTVPVADDIGFLPGTEEEKMTPWMGALADNLEVLADLETGGGWGRAATDDLLRNRIRVRSLNFMRGRTFLNRYVVLDEAQNLTRHQMKTLITRAGPGTKMVCLGNVRQIDTPWLSETTSGLTHVVDRFKQWRHSGHVTLVARRAVAAGGFRGGVALSLPWWRATPLSRKERCRGDACVARKAFVNRRDNTGDACVAPTIVHECTGRKSAGLRKFHARRIRSRQGRSRPPNSGVTGAVAHPTARPRPVAPAQRGRQPCTITPRAFTPFSRSSNACGASSRV